jgi:hypothetical protein
MLILTKTNDEIHVDASVAIRASRVTERTINLVS